MHIGATSYDVVDTANALRYKDAVMKVIIPDMLELERTWIALAHREKGEGCELLGRGFKGFVNKKPKSFYYPLRLIAGVCDFN